MYKYEMIINDSVIDIYFDNYQDKEFLDLKEARHKNISLTGPYIANLDSPHVPQGQKHIHVYYKTNQLFAINVDGSAHDKSHGVKIPGKVAKALSDVLPNFKLPKDNIIESLISNKDYRLDKKEEKFLADLLRDFNGK